MSATLHIPSTAGGIVVDSGQAIGGSGQSETAAGGGGGGAGETGESGDGGNLAGSVINLATNEILATPQIIKLVSQDEGTVEQQSGGSQSGSKVHVISNVTLVSKAQTTPHTINFVNTTSKSINSSANSGYINAFVSKSIPPSGKIVNLVNPIKSSGGNQSMVTQKSAPIVQKVAVPRNVQVLTRVQTLTHATLGGNIIMSRLATTQPQQYQTSPKTTTVKASGYNSIPAKGQKIVSGSPQVFQQGMKIYAGNVGGQKISPQGIKAVSKAVPGLKGSAPGQVTSKMVKQVYNSVNSSAPNLTTITQQYPSTTIPKSTGIHIQSSLNNSGVPVKFNSIASGQQIGAVSQATRTLSGVSNLVIQGSNQKMVKTNKVIQVHHNSSMQQQTGQIPGNQIKMVQNTSVPFNIIQSGTIKYVNAQGNVTQPPTTKTRQNSGTFNSANTFGNSDSGQIQNPTDSTTSDDMMYVNGMSMDEEISARILQSLSQKAVYNNNRYVQQQKYLISSANVTNPVETGPIIQQQFPITQYQTQTQEVKHGPEYFRVNTSDLQTTTTTFIDNIPLVATNEEYYQRDQNYDQDDYTDGEEQITAKDTKLIMQHPALQDHTYAAPMPEGMATQEPAPVENYQNTSANSTETSLAHILMGYSCNQQRQDDDNNSVISNDSRSGKNALENDLGEETETAPEGEGEDDSVTRCICDLTHDDGYMICCDKCSAWQHVDCMGIDRQNIPDEYNCEVCQPRPVDRNRARSLQLVKRKEQQALMLLNTLPQQTIAVESGQIVGGPVMEQQRNLPLNNLSPTTKKQKNLGRKKGEGFVGSKRQKRESGSRANGKRKETKKTTKRKSKQQTENGKEEKSVMGNLRTWIENYELAVTNHYSPELRARLQALGKQQSQQQLNSHSGNLKNVGNLDGKCGTVPHAGGKILISSLEITPNTPIVEIRGKYMLSGQYKQQLISSSNRINRNPGPFIFFYRLPNDGPEICVDTRTYGNDARFVRRSCRPNAEVVHFIEKGTIHLYIVSMLNIKESTEITIRHEPHDLAGVLQGSVAAPSSTVCACGLTKDCMFPNSGAPPLPQPAGGGGGGGGGGGTKNSGKRVNGNYHAKQPKRSKSFSRNRSTSSSGESNVGLLSPNGQVFLPNQISTTALAPPSIQPQLLEAAAAALSSPQASLPPTVTQMINQYPQSPTRNHLNLSTASSATTMSIPGTPTLLSPNVDSVIKEGNTAVALSPIQPPSAPESPIKAPPQVVPVNPPATPVPVAPAIPPPIVPKPAASTTSKRQTKQKNPPVPVAEEAKDEEPKKVAVKAEEKPVQQPKETTTEARKLTREERKMEAIMKAFEKMEKTSQRKQELKQQKTGNSAGGGSSGGPVSRRRNSYSPFGAAQKAQKDEEDKKALNNHQRKKKRKGSKSYQQANSQRKRRRSRMNSNDSDNATSEESSAMLSPPLPGAALYRNSEPVKPQGLDDNAAGMLLALAGAPGGTTTSDDAVPALSEPEVTGNFHNSALSSVCMLVEAAVAPLENQCAENDFKLPHKTKTKKTIMNEWLNQTDTTTGYPGSELFGGGGGAGATSPGKNLETLVQAAVSIHGTQHYRCRMQEEPQNLSMMAKKVEEFISTAQSIAEAPVAPDDDDLVGRNCGQNEEVVLQIPPPLPTPPTAGGSESAVKKRWLRQAISEECLDEMVPSPPNGFMTPLKKRRLARQCSDMVEDLSPTQASFFPMTPQPEDSGKDFPEPVAEVEVKVEKVKEEQTEISNEISEVPQVPQVKTEEIPKEEEEEDAEKIEVKIEDPEKVPKEEIEPESFDIEPLNPEKNEDNPSKEVDGNLGDIEDANSDEIADLQKKIHSFHAENILILKSRNRKAKLRVEAEEEKKPPPKIKKKRFSSDCEETAKRILARSSSKSPPKIEPKVEKSPEPEGIPAPSVLEFPANFNSSIPPPPPTSASTYSSYLLNNATNLMANVPPSNPLCIPPIFSTFPPPQSMSVPPPPLADYMDKPTTFRDIFAPTAAAGVPPRPGYFATLNTPQPVPPPAVPPVTPPTGFLPKASFTTLDTNPAPAVVAPTPRIYTRTASADPRLNPNINVPEPPPAPKRKLSITEYRKRKQQSTDSAPADLKACPLTPEGDAGKEQDGDFLPKNADTCNLSDSKDDSSSSASATKTPSTPEENVPFSPTPTLLELQQESLSERLKSYKSLQELSTTLPAREYFNKGTFEENPSVSSTTCDSVTSSTVVAIASTDSSNCGEDKIETPEGDDVQEITTTCDGETGEEKKQEEVP
ncbi:uncharacterized protein LOC129803087 [Phlebotomus papatasi]|uniref:uncharacterized protein LOC129803087 n=1 Tax=Phlebotomus papatasi TaxID=29031 RepID=UPI0024839F8A|nr:uncharacterized protein LOC129803087 [Phlebotomus papatasi]